MRTRTNEDRRILENTGRVLEGLRKVRGLSREEAAGLAGLHPNTIKRVESGKVEASTLVVTKICAALGCGAVAVGELGFVPSLDGGDGLERALRIRMMPPARIAWRTGESVAALRADLGLGLRSFADRAGVHYNTIWNLERGLVAPSLLTLFRICRAFDIEALDVEGERLTLRPRGASSR
ncbi:MAG: helix-turn-helix transcriptional regulator [Spirochaetales bacterium]|nr:helix-turn-helix transcriptional regulator [Spirochaetales bacterium]